MFTRLRRPPDDEVRRHLAALAAVPFSYRAVGASRTAPPREYRVDHDRTRLGAGGDAFARAREAVRRWEMFRLGWVELVPPEPTLAADATVGVLVRLAGLWSLHPCRIVYLVEEAGPTERFGFAYGTLPGHGASGEERFTVEWRQADDSVWYDRFAFSRPGHPLAWAALPLARRIQRRFGRDSARAMARASRP